MTIEYHTSDLACNLFVLLSTDVLVEIVSNKLFLLLLSLKLRILLLRNDEECLRGGCGSHGRWRHAAAQDHWGWRHRLGRSRFLRFLLGCGPWLVFLLLGRLLLLGGGSWLRSFLTFR